LYEGGFLPSFLCYLSVMTGLVILLIIAGPVLGSCANGAGVGDYIPHWAGGLPKNAPPRPGTPEYDAYRQRLEAEAGRDKSKDPLKAKTEGESPNEALPPPLDRV
jgi:hypothetical protein